MDAVRDDEARSCPTTSTPSKPATRRARADLFARLPAQIAHAMTRARLGEASRRRRSEIGHQPRGARASCRCCASPRCSACRRRRRRSAASTSTPPGKAKRLFMSPGPIFEPEGHGGDYDARARAVRRRLPRGRRRAQLLLAIISRPAPSFWRPARMRSAARSIPGGVGNTEAQLDAIAQLKPVGLCRHAGLSEDPARCGGEGRQGRVLDQARRSSPARRCRPRCARSWPSAASRCSSATRSPRPASSPTRATRCEGMIVNEDMILEIVRPGTGDPVAGRRGRRGRRHHVQSATTR